MKLVLHYQGGFYGYYSPMVLIDTDKHIIAKNDDGPFGKTKEELFDITKYNHLKFFDEKTHKVNQKSEIFELLFYNTLFWSVYY